MINLPTETEALARRLAGLENISVEEAIRLSLEDRARASGIKNAISPEMPRAGVAVRRQRAHEIIQRITSRPVRDPRLVSEIVDDLNAL